MHEQPTSTSHDEVEVALRGGPAGLPERFRIKGLAETVKIPFRNGYEHFCLTSDIAAAATPIFSWTMRTRFAE